jgi:RecA-family ATPase
MKKKTKKTRSSFGDLYKRNRGKKAPKQYWAGIINKSVGLIYGPAKSGKTILCENLAFSIVCGRKSFLEISIGLPKSKVLFISMEEDTDMKMIQRGKKQIRGFSRVEKKLIKENLSYSDIDFIRSVENKEHWRLLENEIKRFESNLIFIDSTNRFNYDIEKKLEANLMMQEFRNLAVKYNCAIVLIHHAVKSQENQPMSLNKMSGSSALARDADYFIGVNRLTNGTRYVKFIDGRYFQPIEKCKVISIQHNFLIDLEGEIYESELLKAIDERYSSNNTNKLIEFIIENIKSDEVFETKLLQSHFVDEEGIMTKATMHNNIKKIEGMTIIKKVGHGKYKRIDKDTNT